jgi:hypothetical protein
MREKLKAVLHRRKGSTPTQSPRASYEQSDEGSPRAEQHPTSPRQRHRRSSSSSQNAPPQTNHVHQSKTTHKSVVASHSTDPPRVPIHDIQHNNANLKQVVSDENRSLSPALAHSGQSTVGSSGIGHSTASHNGDVLKPLPAIPGMINTVETLSEPREITLYTGSTKHNQVDAQDNLVGRAVTTNSNIVAEAQHHDIEDSRSQPQRSERDRHSHRDIAVKPAGFDSTSDKYGQNSSDDWQAKQKSMLKGIVDLNDTVQTDRETSWAPGKSFFFCRSARPPNTIDTKWLS